MSSRNQFPFGGAAGSIPFFGGRAGSGGLPFVQGTALNNSTFKSFTTMNQPDPKIWGDAFRTTRDAANSYYTRDDYEERRRANSNGQSDQRRANSSSQSSSSSNSSSNSSSG